MKALDRAIKACDQKKLKDMNVNELRELAVSLGADRNKLYGASKETIKYILYHELGYRGN